MLDSDWNEDAKQELRAIEAAYSSSKRKCSDFNLEVSSSSQHRRLPGWSTTREHRAGNYDLASKIDATLCPMNGFRAFSPLPCQANVKLSHPVLSFGGRIVYCKTSAEVEQAAKDLVDKIEKLRYNNANEISLGFDIEWKPNFVKGQAPRKIAVMQLCMDSSDCYIMHIIHSGIPLTLKFLLEDPSSSKVGIGISNDATKISKEYNICITSLVDLSRYANLKLGGAYKNWGLSSLTQRLACKQLVKSNKIRMGNWEIEELSKEQLRYAATDAFASWHLYEILKTFPDPSPNT